MTREELLALGFSEDVVNEKLGVPEAKYNRADTIHAWKVAKHKTKLTRAEHDELTDRIKEYNANGDYTLAKLTNYKVVEND